jgi:hypothetical protein
MQSLGEGIKFVFNNKTVLGAITLDMVAVLFLGAVALLPIFARHIKVGRRIWFSQGNCNWTFITMLITYVPLSKYG